eukprot:4859411-Prorocentrum_lima.AAC.1
MQHCVCGVGGVGWCTLLGIVRVTDMCPVARYAGLGWSACSVAVGLPKLRVTEVALAWRWRVG